MNGWMRQKYVYVPTLRFLGVLHVFWPMQPFVITLTSPPGPPSLQSEAFAGRSLTALIGIRASPPW